VRDLNAISCAVRRTVATAPPVYIALHFFLIIRYGFEDTVPPRPPHAPPASRAAAGDTWLQRRPAARAGQPRPPGAAPPTPPRNAPRSTPNSRRARSSARSERIEVCAESRCSMARREPTAMMIICTSSVRVRKSSRCGGSASATSATGTPPRARRRLSRRRPRRRHRQSQTAAAAGPTALRRSLCTHEAVAVLSNGVHGDPERFRPEPWAHPPGRAVPAAHLALWAAQRRSQPASCASMEKRSRTASATVGPLRPTPPSPAALYEAPLAAFLKDVYHADSTTHTTDSHPKSHEKWPSPLPQTEIQLSVCPPTTRSNIRHTFYTYIKVQCCATPDSWSHTPQQQQQIRQSTWQSVLDSLHGPVPL